MTASVLALAAAVGCYGVAGARLSSGARQAGSALRSAAWWTGTGLQAAGFVLSLLARAQLPLLVVQAAVVAALAVTAVVQALTGGRRLGARDLTAIGATVTGVALLGAATVPGESGAASAALVGCLVAATAAGGAGLAAHPTAVGSGVLAGLGYTVGAVGARFLVSALPSPVWALGQLTAAAWAIGVLTAAGIVLGQVHLTRGLRVAPAVPVLAAMYLVQTVVPAAIGHWLLDERLRPGWTAGAVLGLLAALGGALALLRREPAPRVGQPT